MFRAGGQSNSTIETGVVRLCDEWPEPIHVACAARPTVFRSDGNLTGKTNGAILDL